MQIDAILAHIRFSHRERCFAMEQRKRADLSLLSFLRTQAGWRLDLPEKERKAIAERAKAFAAGNQDAELDRYRAVVDAAVAARKPFDDVEAAAVKEMESLAVQLPVWERFGKAIRGFGPASLAVIVGEAGDLSLYPNPAKLWKRMGVGVVDGIRQGGLAKNASKEDWIVHGYNRQRRSRMWNIGDALIKGNRDGEYRTLYLQRKEYEIARNPEMTPMQAHRRAQRYMEKRLLRNLWAAWRQTILDPQPRHLVSAAENSDQQAAKSVEPTARPPAAATGHNGIETHLDHAGRSPSNGEAIEDAPPKRLLPRKRRSSVLVTPDQGMTGAPIQQAIDPPQPNGHVPAGSPTILSSRPKRVTSGSNISRASGTGGQSAIDTQSRGAAR